MQTAHFTECLVYLLSNLQSKIQYKKAFWYVIQCSVVNWYRRLAKMCRLRFQVILFCSYQTTRSHEREYRKLEFLRLLASSRLSIRFFRLSVCMSVRTDKLDSHTMDFMEFDIWGFFENLMRKIKIY